jgi:hypothetical protein
MPVSERRSTAALQDAGEETALRTAARLWSAAVLRRFAGSWIASRVWSFERLQSDSD